MHEVHPPAYSLRRLSEPRRLYPPPRSARRCHAHAVSGKAQLIPLFPSGFEVRQSLLGVLGRRFIVLFLALANGGLEVCDALLRVRIGLRLFGRLERISRPSGPDLCFGQP